MFLMVWGAAVTSVFVRKVHNWVQMKAERVPFKMTPDTILLNIGKGPNHECKWGNAPSSNMQFSLGGGYLHELIN